MELQKKWFVYMDDHHEGPFSPDEIFQKQKSGAIHQESYVWCEGMSDWQLIEQVPELKTALQQLRNASPASSSAPAAASSKPAPRSSAPNVKLTPVEKTTTGIRAVDPNVTSTLAAGADPSTPDRSPPTNKSRSALKFLLIGVLLVLILAVGGLAVVSRSAGEETHAMIRPTLMKILDRVPALTPLFRLAPKIADVKQDELSELEDAMVGKPEEGVKVALALSHGDPNRPYFYVGTNLPDKTKLDLYLVGNGETLLNRLSFNAQSTVTTRFGLGRSEVILAVGGQPVPKGEYQVFAVEASDQDESVRPTLTSLPAARSPIKSPPEVPTATKFLFVKSFFVGGERDDTYLTRLKAFHEKVKQSADRELQELKQYADTLQMQYTSLTDDFSKVYKAKKITPQIKALWSKTSSTWQQINGQMDQTIQTWTKETLQNEFFYGKSYELVKNAHDSIQKLFTVESGFVNQPGDRAGFEIEHGKALSEARDSLEQLKSKVDQILKAPKTASGLPTREGS